MFLLPEIKDVADLKDRVSRNTALPSSVLYCVAAIEEGLLYLNGSPQNTFHPGIIEYAKEKGAFLGGSDFKSGQTRFKTMMSDFLIGAGIRLSSVAPTTISVTTTERISKKTNASSLKRFPRLVFWMTQSLLTLFSTQKETNTSIMKLSSSTFLSFRTPREPSMSTPPAFS